MGTSGGKILAEQSACCKTKRSKGCVNYWLKQHKVLFEGADEKCEDKTDSGKILLIANFRYSVSSQIQTSTNPNQTTVHSIFMNEKTFFIVCFKEVVPSTEVSL